MPKMPILIITPDITPETSQDIVDWIDNVVNEFCLSENRKWDKFLKTVDQGEPE